MQQSMRGWLAAVSLGVVLMGTYAVQAQDVETASRPNYVTPATLADWLAEGRPVTFLDVREADEFEAGHLPGAINMSYERVASIADTLSRTQPIVLYCIHSAHRAPEAAKTLNAMGIDNTYVLEGGIVAWQADGHAIQAADLARAPTILLKTERCEQLAQP